MSVTSVKKAIQQALETPANRQHSVTRNEAREIIKAATEGARGPDGVSKSEAELLAQLAGESGFDSKAHPYKLTDAGRRELETFFAKNNLPLGANAEKLHATIDAVLAGADLSQPLAKAPSTRGLNPLSLGEGREAFIDSKNGTFLLKDTSGEQVRWHGPLSLEAQPADDDGGIDALRSQIAAATDGLLFTSESDYPFDFFLAAGEGKTKPTAEQFLQIVGKPADTTVEVRSFDEFFSRRTTPQEWWGDYEKNDAAKYQQLRTALESNLTDLQVIRTGEIEIGVYIVGRNANGDLVGVSTTSIET